MICSDSLSSGIMRDLRISGQPSVPSSIDLLADDVLGPWRTFTPGNAGQMEEREQVWINNGYSLDQPLMDNHG